jgi:hypothetical protein
LVVPSAMSSVSRTTATAKQGVVNQPVNVVDKPLAGVFGMVYMLTHFLDGLHANHAWVIEVDNP